VTVLSRFVALLLTAGAIASCADRGTEPRTATIERPDAIAERLQQTGELAKGPRAIVYFEGDGLDPSARQAWADRISKGIDDLETLLRLPFAPGMIEFYVTSARDPVSFAIVVPKPRVFLSKARVLAGAAPYLHEAVHILMTRHARARDATAHAWALEGVPSYIEDAVVETFGGVPGGVVSRDGNHGIDRQAAEVLAAENADQLIRFIGATGVPENYGVDRERVRVPFYVLSQSFTKHIVDLVGLDQFVEHLFPYIPSGQAFEGQVLKLAGQSIAELKAGWLAKLQSPSKPALG
jgi:hypothetical protein